RSRAFVAGSRRKYTWTIRPAIAAVSRPTMRICPAIGFVLMLSRLALAADAPELKPLRWNIDGERREAIVVFPDARHNKSAPVVFVFHGHGSTMEAFARRWDVHKHWPEAVAVYYAGLAHPEPGG